MFDSSLLHSELQFHTARSGGKGGQNVNKIETKVELRFDVTNTLLLGATERQILLDKLANRLTSEGVLILTHQTERSQLANKEKVIKKFDRLIQQCFEQPKPRKPSQPTLQSIQKRRQAKERNAAIKAMRRKVDE